jgi:hypothetical protein
LSTPTRGQEAADAAAGMMLDLAEKDDTSVHQPPNPTSVPTLPLSPDQANIATLPPVPNAKNVPALPSIAANPLPPPPGQPWTC